MLHQLVQYLVDAHPSPYNNYGFVEFATTGNAQDFGDLSGNVGLGGASNGHGGL